MYEKYAEGTGRTGLLLRNEQKESENNEFGYEIPEACYGGLPVCHAKT